MRTFEEFVTISAGNSGGYNIGFEAGMFALSNDVELVVEALRAAGVQFEIIGGVAVNAHLFPEHRDLGFGTRDIDVLVNRSDLQATVSAAEALGYRAKKMIGGYALVRPQQKLGEAVHLIFVGEVSKSTQLSPHPELQPEDRDFYGINVPVAPLRDLVQMKLNAFRLKDLRHLEILDDAGLLTPEIERDLPEVLKSRLRDAREQFARDKPDVEG